MWHTSEILHQLNYCCAQAADAHTWHIPASLAQVGMYEIWEWHFTCRPAEQQQQNGDTNHLLHGSFEAKNRFCIELFFYANKGIVLVRSSSATSPEWQLCSFYILHIYFLLLQIYMTSYLVSQRLLGIQYVCYVLKPFPTWHTFSYLCITHRHLHHLFIFSLSN